MALCERPFQTFKVTAQPRELPFEGVITYCALLLDMIDC
jgi:hypothetical protein